MSDKPCRREFTRVVVKLEAELQSGGTKRIKGCLCDLSLNGFYLECTESLPMHSDCQVALFLDGGIGDFCIQASGVVARVDDSGIAIQFTNILGEESLTHLHNLVMFNSHDQVPLVEEEIQGHIGLKPKTQ
ncbi:MAG: hypothetical protein NPIRA05_02170 [Nitrospirales bacterium]|nr:MAG: hypothetical protein NPIRA05_02170 [Nitrospirales bacterium]